MNFSLPTTEAAHYFRLSTDTMRRFARGRKGSASHPAFEPILKEGVHWFRRSAAKNSTIVFRIPETAQVLAEHGYVVPQTNQENHEHC